MIFSGYAKVTLLLSVGARRPNGLHELVSVMQTVSLEDSIEINAGGEFTLLIQPSFEFEPPNLIERAARALASAQGADLKLLVELRKRIPVAAGLGGGSADAAATLVGYNQLLGSPLSKKALEKIAATLGSDVSFCVRGGTAIVSGTGEDVMSLPSPQQLWWVLGISQEALPTAEVYAEFDRLGGGSLADSHELADALARGDVERIVSNLRNDLEPAARALLPGLERGADALRDAGALGVVLAGSGPTWCGLASDREHSERIASGCATAFARVEVVRTVDHGPRALRG